MTIIFPFLKAENVIKVYLMSFLFVLRTLVHFYVIYKFYTSPVYYYINNIANKCIYQFFFKCRENIKR